MRTAAPENSSPDILRRSAGRDPHGIFRAHRSITPLIKREDGAYLAIRANDVERLATDPRTDFLNNLIDEIGDRETHPLAGLLEIVGCFVREYEESI